MSASGFPPPGAGALAWGGAWPWAEGGGGWADCVAVAWLFWPVWFWDAWYRNLGSLNTWFKIGVGTEELGYCDDGDGCGSVLKKDVIPDTGSGGAVAEDGDDVCDFECIGIGKVVIGLRVSGDRKVLKLEYLGVLMLGPPAGVELDPFWPELVVSLPAEWGLELFALPGIEPSWGSGLRGGFRRVAWWSDTG